MNFISLFSGIGGFDLGLERAGMTCIGQVEIDPACIKILEKHWPNVKRVKDVHDVTGDEFGPAELICAGYPCQGESTSGKRRGTEDHRWLWPECFRIVKRKRSAWFIGENVIGHESMGLRVVISDLESAGYRVRSFIIPSAACGLQTVERHIWIIAAASCVGHEGSEEIADPYYGNEWKFQRANTRIGDRWNLPESRVYRIRKEVPSGVDRLRMIGNAVPPQIPEIIGRCILEIEKHYE
jgi:DNA (cytosine-5)-methyltransferase 1